MKRHRIQSAGDTMRADQNITDSQYDVLIYIIICRGFFKKSSDPKKCYVKFLYNYSAERKESRLTTFSFFSPYLCHTKRYDHKAHIKMILILY